MPTSKPLSGAGKDGFISYLVVFILIGTALLFTSAIYQYVTPMISPLFLFAVIVLAWRFGLKHAILGTFLSGVAIDFFFIEPQKQLSLGINDIIRLSIFFIEGVGFSLLINSRKKATEAVTESREQLLALSLRETTAREEERRRLSLEVHDELGQSLTSLKMQLHLLRKKLLGGIQGDEVSDLAGGIDPLLAQVDGTISSVRRIATELRPPVLDDLGLVPALEWQAHEFRRASGIDCTFRSNVETLDLGSQVATAIFRIFQEALTNVARHSEARNVFVVLKANDGEVVLRVEDDGVGLRDLEIGEKRSLGVLGMKERARNIGGTLDVFSGDERGTVVTLSAPTTLSEAVSI